MEDAPLLLVRAERTRGFRRPECDRAIGPARMWNLNGDPRAMPKCSVLVEESALRFRYTTEVIAADRLEPSLIPMDVIVSVERELSAKPRMRRRMMASYFSKTCLESSSCRHTASVLTGSAPGRR